MFYKFMDETSSQNDQSRIYSKNRVNLNPTVIIYQIISDHTGH